MIKGRKVIGVCLTRIHDATRSDYINRLHHIATAEGFKLIMFNSFVDFFNNDNFDEGAKSVYEVINYDIVDALVVLYDSFVDKSVADEVIAKARQHDVPVVLVNGKAASCWSVTSHYEEALKEIMTHVIRDHGVTDTFFIAGNREGDLESQTRIRCYKEALEECGLPYEESRVDFGGYWEDPTMRIVRSLCTDREPPKAIFCANDYMAFTACEELARHGYSVPADVIVTGFDGVPEAEHYTPQLTTCREDIEGLARVTVEAIGRALTEKMPYDLKNFHTPRISESCGCTKLTEDQFRDVAAELYRTIHEMEMHEDFEYAWIDHMLEITDINSLYETLAGCMLENSYVCLNTDFLASIMDLNREKQEKTFSDELVIIPSKYTHDRTELESKMPIKDIVPCVEEWAEDNTCYIISSVFVGGEVCGYYAVRTDNIPYSKHKMKRVLKTINIAFNVAINYFRQANMRVRIEHAALTNTLTGLPNLKGAAKWFEEFSNNQENHEMAISFSVYGLPKYAYILENYGIDAAEEALRFVAEALKVANPTDCLIAHVADDEFAVINYYKDPNTIGDSINRATGMFFPIIEGYNTNSGKEYYVEVNCGCTVVYSGWNGNLESFLKFANSEMYMNRLKMGTGAVVKPEEAPKQVYKAFDLLLEKNLFTYHFQPIVSAKTGEIYAYEALMRTDASIGMNPLQVLEAAREYGRLYDIEYATMFNVMERVAKNVDSFGNAKVFINTIPGHFLDNTHIQALLDKYGEYMDRFVYELTEQDTVSDEELANIRRLCGEENANQIAIDDYGTGHSNIVNLMRYAPQVIKIDRFLVSDIDRDQNKQMFVRSTIEFARINGIKVLAEGVETSNELRMVIDLGVDLIQGYYTGRPAPEPVGEIAAEIRREIVHANPLFGQNR